MADSAGRPVGPPHRVAGDAGPDVAAADRRGVGPSPYTSPKAYGCTAYLRFRQSDGSFSVSFVTSKGRMAPLRQQQTLPRLELLACVMAAQMVEYLLKVLHLAADTP